jgi:acyl-CoA reductase-like NAD-dependent aldehyde dehydrogenase
MFVMRRYTDIQADPATGEKLWDVPIANQQDVDDAVVSAQKAFEKWSQVP